MRFSTILNLGLIAAGAAASLRTLNRRRRWERANRRGYIVLDYDDALSVSTRAGLPLGELLHEAHHHGATHLALPELTLNRLMARGRIATTIPPSPEAGWTYLACGEQSLAEHLAREIAARLPTAA